MNKKQLMQYISSLRLPNRPNSTDWSLFYCFEMKRIDCEISALSAKRAKLEKELALLDEVAEKFTALTKKKKGKT